MHILTKFFHANDASGLDACKRALQVSRETSIQIKISKETEVVFMAITLLYPRYLLRVMVIIFQ